MELWFAKQTRRKSQPEETAAAGHGDIMKVQATLQGPQMLQVWPSTGRVGHIQE